MLLGNAMTLSNGLRWAAYGAAGVLATAFGAFMAPDRKPAAPDTEIAPAAVAWSPEQDRDAKRFQDRLDPSAPLPSAPAPTPAVRPGLRLSYVPLDALRLAPPLFDNPMEENEGDDAILDAWSLVVQPEVAAPSGPSLTRGTPPPLLPWLDGETQAGAPARTYTLQQRLAEISPGATQRLIDKFKTASVAWPATDMALVAIKDEKILELFARPVAGEWKLIHRYPVLAASGVSGPKLRKGDKQVPEGIYGISFLNPNSRYHVSLRVNYPNQFDRQMADKDGRKELGGDIMIHGKNASVGCLAVGDAAAEELFVLAANIGLPNIQLIIAPSDFRRNGIPEIEPNRPTWLSKLYIEVASAMSEFKGPPSTGILSLFGN